MTETSWLYDTSIPTNQWTMPTQSTAFGTSSLASASVSMLAYDPGSQIYHLRQLTNGNNHANNTIIYSEDKSQLGIEVERRRAGLRYPKKDPNALTVPNVYSLNDKHRL